MSLFQSIRRLFAQDRFPLEDFHTEIVANVLQNHPALAVDWLRKIGATTLETDGTVVTVRSQVEFPALDDHRISSRVDLIVWLSTAAGTELIFVESKVGSTQGGDQLQRYADHLGWESREPGTTKGTLVFITRDFESVTPPGFQNSPLCKFIPPTRWFIFFHCLGKYAASSTLAAELQSFMKENNMSLGTRFRPADVLTLQNVLHTKSLLDETLESVRKRAFEVVGVKPKTRSRSMNELQICWRYVWQFALGNSWDFELLVGYWFSDETNDDRPWIGVALVSNPNSTRSDEIREAFRSLSENGWRDHGSNSPKEWFGVEHGKPLRAILGESDQIEAIKQLLLSSLEAVAAFRAAHPQLPWGAETVVDDDSAEN